MPPPTKPNPSAKADPQTTHARLLHTLATLTTKRDSYLSCPPPPPSPPEHATAASPPRPANAAPPATSSSSSTHSFTPAQAPLACLPAPPPPTTTTTTTTTTGPAATGTETTAKDAGVTFVSIADAQAVLRRHIRLLHDYNSVRDVGMGLLGLLAERKGVRVVEVMEGYGLGAGD